MFPIVVVLNAEELPAFLLWASDKVADEQGRFNKDDARERLERGLTVAEVKECLRVGEQMRDDEAVRAGDQLGA